MPKLKSTKISGYEFLINSDVGYYPFFSFNLKNRVHKKIASNIVVTGDSGIGKTYLATDNARILDKRFSIDEVVFRFNEFMRAVLTTKMGIPIVFDEPSYAIGKRDWYKELQQALVKTIESFRFKVHPLYIPVINKSLLDKTIRSYLIQFHIVMRDRGDGVVYRIYPSQFKDKIFNYEFCKLKYAIFDSNICKKDSCLSCKKLDPSDTSLRCMIFRSQYERKKGTTQEERYKKAQEDADKKEVSNLSTEELETKAMQYFDLFYIKDKNKIDVEKMKIILWKNLKMRVGHNKVYQLRKLIELDYPDRFAKPETIIEQTANTN